jgi:cob(I)alamin adenosyltransferase
MTTDSAAANETDTTREHQPVKGPRIKKGLVVVNTGNGKGKTTAALGVLFRAWGRDGHARGDVPVPEAYRVTFRREPRRR